MNHEPMPPQQTPPADELPMSPALISIALHYYAFPGNYPGHGRSPEAQLIRHGILQQDDVGIGITPRGRAWIWMLLRTPFPEQAYVDPRDWSVIR